MFKNLNVFYRERWGMSKGIYLGSFAKVSVVEIRTGRVIEYALFLITIDW